MDKVELRRLYFSVLDHVLVERRFSERNSKLAAALVALDPESDTFLDVKAVQPLMELTKSTIVEMECIVATQYFARVKKDDDKKKMAVSRLLSHGVLQAMPTVLLADKLLLTLGASITMCEKSFSVLKNVFADHRRKITHSPKAQLVLQAFERDLTRKLRDEWENLVLRKFSKSSLIVLIKVMYALATATLLLTTIGVYGAAKDKSLPLIILRCCGVEKGYQDWGSHIHKTCICTEDVTECFSSLLLAIMILVRLRRKVDVPPVYYSAEAKAGNYASLGENEIE
ncbi:unnamed protein product [Merluccius merluccius]